MTNPNLDRLEEAARGKVRSYASLVRGSIEQGVPASQAGAQLVAALHAINTDRDTAIALLAVAVLELVTPPADLSHLEF